MGKLLKGAIIGGLIVFVWSFVSHMFLGWHMLGFKEFSSDVSVGQALTSQTNSSGMYIYPQTPDTEGMSAEDAKAAETEAMEQWAEGPSALIIYNAGSWSMGTQLVQSLVINFVTAFLIMGILLAAPGLSFWGKVIFIVIAGTAGFATAHLQLWTWWHFPTVTTLVNIVDQAIAWFLAGMAMVKWGVPKDA